jgi:hypothetical protein
VISQSAQFAPFSHDYVFANDTSDKWKVFNTNISRPNTYKYAFISYNLRCIADNLLWGRLLRGSALSVTCPSVQLYLTLFLNLVDNKLCLASRSSHLTFSKDQDRFSIPLVRHGSLLSLFVLIRIAQASNTLQIPSRAQMGLSHGKWTANRRSEWVRLQSDLIRDRMALVSVRD